MGMPLSEGPFVLGTPRGIGQVLAGTAMQWGAQDCSPHEHGAYTGEVSAAMLVEFGCRYAIVGHSERRMLHAESDEVVALKASRP